MAPLNIEANNRPVFEQHGRALLRRPTLGLSSRLPIEM